MAETSDFKRQITFIEGLIRQRDDLKSTLRSIWESEPIWPPQSALQRFALSSLNVKPDKLPAWYRNAWWGMHAAIVLRGKTLTDHGEDVLPLIDDDFSFAPLTSALAAGRGAILLNSHLGPGYVPPYAFRRAGFDLKGIARTKMRSRRAVEQFIFVTTPSERKTSLVQAVKHLRKGGVLFAAPTGQEGGTSSAVTFLGHNVRLYHGICEIARITGAPLFWSSASWAEPTRLRLILQELPAISAEDDDGWRTAFFTAYLTRLARQMLTSPADLGFYGGFWNTLPWYQADGKAAHTTPA